MEDFIHSSLVVANNSLYLNFPIIGRVIMIWDGLFFKLKVFFDLLIIRKKLFLVSSHLIDTYLYVVVEVIEVLISFSFELCIHEEFI